MMTMMVVMMIMTMVVVVMIMIVEDDDNGIYKTEHTFHLRVFQATIDDRITNRISRR